MQINHVSFSFRDNFRLSTPKSASIAIQETTNFMQTPLLFKSEKYIKYELGY